MTWVLWLVRLANLGCERTSRSQRSRVAVSPVSSLLTILSYFSLRCEYEESASDIVDHGLERQPVRSRKSNDSKSRARTDHEGARNRVGELVYGYQVDDK